MFEFHLPTGRQLQTLERGFSLYGCSDENPETVDIFRMFQGFTNRYSSFLGTQSDVFIDDAAHLLAVEMHQIAIYSGACRKFLQAYFKSCKTLSHEKFQ
jgi:hypothetical protein